MNDKKEKDLLSKRLKTRYEHIGAQKRSVQPYPVPNSDLILLFPVLRNIFF